MVKRKIDKYIFSWMELMEAASQGGCLICNAVEKKLEYTYQRLLSEEIVNPECREQIRTGLGFCQFHAHKLLEIEEKNSHDNYFTALYYADLLSHLLLVLEKASAQRRQRVLGDALANLFRNDCRKSFNPFFCKSCRVCQAKKTHEDFFVGEFLRYLESTEFVEAYQRHAWLCFPHFFQVINYPLPTKYQDLVLDLQQSRVGKLIEQLKNYQEQILKVTEPAISDWINSPELSVSTVRGKLL